ncbi:MAG TPA: hypothetical protein EYG78_02765 [Sulfurovum sp.]|nr:hypothetical protein [Sulfurovum sp.]
MLKMVLGMLLSVLLFAEEKPAESQKSEKRSILSSMKESYYILPQEVDTLESNTIALLNGESKTKLDPSYSEARFEINYLF